MRSITTSCFRLTISHFTGKQGRQKARQSSISGEDGWVQHSQNQYCDQSQRPVSNECDSKRAVSSVLRQGETEGEGGREEMVSEVYREHD